MTSSEKLAKYHAGLLYRCEECFAIVESAVTHECVRHQGERTCWKVYE